MRVEKAEAHFGNRSAIAKALGDARSVSAVYQWQDVVPLAAARRLEQATNGALKVDESLYNEFGQIIRKHKRKAH